jgi:hypothetical protein
MSLFHAADTLFSSRTSGTLSPRTLSASQRALSCLRGFLSRAAAIGSISNVLELCARALPARRGLGRPLCCNLERGGELVNAQIDLRTALQFTLAELSLWLSGTPDGLTGVLRFTLLVSSATRSSLVSSRRSGALSDVLDVPHMSYKHVYLIAAIFLYQHR